MATINYAPWSTQKNKTQVITNNLVKLNIASGPSVFKNWINYDRDDVSEHINYTATAINIEGMPQWQKDLGNYLRNGGKIDFRVHNLKNGFPQHADNSVDIINMGQAIEHLNVIYETPQFLNECYRMLKPGGLIRMATPDLDILIKAYLDNDMDKFSIEQPAFYKNADPSAQLSYLMFGSCGPKCSFDNYEGHFFLFTQKSMTKILKDAGFKDIIFYYETGKSLRPEILDDIRDFGISHSFIVEALK